MLVKDMNRPVFLIMDASQVHRSKILREYVEESGGILSIFFLTRTRPILTRTSGSGNKSSMTTSAGRPSRASGSSRNSPRPRSPMKEIPGKIRAFFADPSLRYISDSLA